MKLDSTSSELSPLNGQTNRRQALKRLGMGAAGLAGLGMLAGRAQAAFTPAPDASSTDPFTAQDAAILQFALNLEYLEAQYYSYGVNGTGINPVLLTGTGTPGTVSVKANPRVTFATPAIQQYAQEIAEDERIHVYYLRNVLQFFGVTPVAQPAIDLQASFNALAQAAGIGPSFDPFANEANFILGAYIFEDVGVTAYRGAAPLLNNIQVLGVGAGLLGTEAYHASLARVTIAGLLGSQAIGIAQKISDLRDTLDGNSAGPGFIGSAPDDDEGLMRNGRLNIVPTASNGTVFGRSTRQVLNILYFAQGATQGGFFPNGLNGPISS